MDPIQQRALTPLDGATRGKKGFGLNSCAKRKAAKAQRKDMMSSKATLLQATARQIIKVIGEPKNGEH